MPQSRFRAGAALVAAIILAVPLAASRADETAAIRCRWASPNDRTALEYVFENNPLVVMLPGENLELSPVGDGVVVVYKDGTPLREEQRLNFTAPERPGSYFIPIAVASASGRREMELCVLVPYRGSGVMNADGCLLAADGRTIGRYRHPDRSGNAKVKANPACYQPPPMWLRITEANAGFEVVPGLPAADLVAPTEDTGLKHTDMVPVAYPMWNAVLVLRNSLPAIGVPPDAMKLISVFRTPEYNRQIGSNAFGRHVYGDAFDFYITLDGGIKAADLNRDGRLDRRDAYPVVALIENLQADGRLPMGGIGVYNTVAGDHEVTMHVDARGHRATWGYFYSASGKKSDFAWQSVRFADLDRREEGEAAMRAAREGRKYAPPRREPLGP